MKVITYGSLNVDYVYSVDHILKEGETISSSKREVFPGGKGLNQTVALAKAGVDIYLAGNIGDDGAMLLDVCKEAGIRTDYLNTLPGPGGHTVIQVDKNGQNSILLFGGSNQAHTKEEIDCTLDNFEKGDVIVLQNEINLLDYIIDKAYEKEMMIVLNPSPYDDKLNDCDMGKVSLFLVNEIEAGQMTGEEDIEKLPDALKKTFPDARFVLTLGSRGSVYIDADKEYHQDIVKVEAVDTTAAGDTFTGYFLGASLEGKDEKEALKIASLASSIAVSRQGAASSIPAKAEVLEALSIL